MDHIIEKNGELEKVISDLKDFYSTENGKRQRIKEEITKNKNELGKIKEELDLLEKVNVLLQKTSEYAREQAKKQIESLVTNCLQYVLDTNVEFKIEIEELYGKPNAEFYVISKYENQEVKTKPHQSRGGGIVDIISLALRIAFLQIHKPLIQGPIILDEPAKHVSEEYIFNVAEFLKQVSEMFNRQIIMVTHNTHLASVATNSYRVELKGLTSKVEKLST
ncbi:ATPase [Thermohalobacter berrensis]|uniref:Nuclease SbcCD subunit C n=1 Tax=Thermohalobacter berrensis TaxID=99594 RepID=A0A419TAK3_9FIRM|nr:ATPase [Thermohalobacter berrensis]RKD34500.1 ATPase [Thermohalobacter berrensis]